MNVIWEKDDHFEKMDSEMQKYDFQLDSLSKAINLGNNEDSRNYPFDLKGRSRLNDEAPDAGCYEWIKKEDE